MPDVRVADDKELRKEGSYSYARSLMKTDAYLIHATFLLQARTSRLCAFVFLSCLLALTYLRRNEITREVQNGTRYVTALSAQPPSTLMNNQRPHNEGV